MLNVEITYILKLKKNNMELIEKNILPKISKYHIYEVDGISIKNEGKIDINLFTILTHNHMNEVSIDITKNFINMIKHAYSNNYNRVLFLEEDACFVDISDNKKKKVNDWLDMNQTWDIFYLGYCNWPCVWSFYISSNIVKLTNPLLAHAFILNKRGMEKVLNYTENGNKNMNYHFDKIIGNNIKSFYRYGMFPMCSFQDKNPALLQKALDSLNINMSCKTLCKINEILSLIIPILVILIFVFFLFKIFF